MTPTNAPSWLNLEIVIFPPAVKCCLAIPTILTRSSTLSTWDNRCRVSLCCTRSLHSRWRMTVSPMMVGKGRISAWPTDRPGVTLDRHFRIGVHDHLPVLVLVHQMCAGVSVSSFQPLSTDGLSLSHFQSKPKLCNGPCNRRNLNDDMQRKIRYNLLCGSKSIFVMRKLHTSLIEINSDYAPVYRWFIFWVAECK